MKKICLTFIAIMAVAQFSFAQNTFPSSGYVGIGTTSPGKLFTIQGDSAILRLQSPSNPAGYYTDIVNKYSLVKPFYISTNSYGGFGLKTLGLVTPTDYPVAYVNGPYGIAFVTGGNVDPASSNVRMSISNLGKVGIGTTTPGSQFDVYHVGTGSALRVGGGAYGTSNDAGIDLYANNANNVPVYARIALGVNTGTLGSETGYLNFSTINAGSLSEKMRITNTGNVLIGKTTQINSSYMLDVAGNVRANQVTVNTTGADFVFEPTYQLRPLASLQEYININHHLPEIASAKQMQTEGLNVGDNQVKLLQKIEELTLYLIELKKENETLKRGQEIINQKLKRNQIK
ncbi:MAG TPA: hypothetical protein VGI43_01385 [Mucilaginibacter sp.]|jgi:hypothetical protein